jgi:hypothetical protein
MIMDQAQLEQLVQGVASMLQQGASPDQAAQQLAQQGLPEEAIGQVIDAAMQMVQGGGQGGQMAQQGGAGSGLSGEGADVLESVLSQVGPEVMAAIIGAWEEMSSQERSTFMQTLRQMGQGQQTPEGRPSPNEAEQNMFG